MAVTKYKLDWEEFHLLAKRLANKIKKDERHRVDEIGTILAVSRGGLTLAHILAVELGIKHVYTICISSYSGRKQEAIHIYGSTPSILLSDYTLIVDDLIDSGDSLNMVREVYPNRYMEAAVLLSKSKDKKARYVGKFIDPKLWVVFPWEKKNAS